ncbi:leukemia inhibitory factor receptor isoform X2 [Leuresthes tenuis]|uniref:leukemia inhibitory factor receptor isoform X2 n=1 Tax=Leuresthes tenuis TaxID=355514 RepID=UPI003B504A36
MISVRVFCTSLLVLFLIFFKDPSDCCIGTGSPPPKPNITHLKANSDKKSLVVSWLGNHTASSSDIYEIQVSRTEEHAVIYNINVSVHADSSAEYTWTWTSDLPLECVDHSVRIRFFCNQSAPSLWSNWITNYGVKAKDKTKIFPFQRVLREGSSAMFCCIPPEGVNITSIAFRKSQFPYIDIGARVKAIAVHNLTIPNIRIKHLLLTCTETTGNNSHTWNYISFPPQKPRNLSCATSDMTTITCNWDSGRKHDPSDRSKRTQTLHIRNSNQATINCETSSCSFPAVPQLQEYNICVLVKNKLGEETESYSFNISDRVFPVLEWDRVSPGVTNVSLSWSVSGNLTQMTLLCQVSTVPVSITQLNCNSASGLCKVRLDNLHPNTNYSARVRCSVNGRLWGEWTRPISYTTYPLVTLDLWRRIKQLSDSYKRHVTLLWNPHVVGRAGTVNITGYSLKWSQGGQIRRELKESGQSQVEVSIGPARCDFTVQAVLQSGSSIPAHITIPPQDHTDIHPVNKQLNSTTAGFSSLSWDHQSTVTCGYTVEWCIMRSFVPCILKWIKVPKGNNTLDLRDGDFKAGFRYAFNIYGCTENGHNLLEIQTGYSQELTSVQSPGLVEPVQSTSSSVALEWRYNEDDPAQPAFITGYLVTVQEVGSDILPGQTEMADPLQKSVTIKGLRQNQEYTCSVSALTKVGPGLPASVIIRTKIDYSAHLPKILTPILLLLGCTILLWPQRKMLKSVLREIFVYPAGMKIKKPEFDSFLNEAAQRLQSQRVEECICCDIEILNIRPRLNETTSVTDTLCSPCSPSSISSKSPTCVPLKAEYHPQSAILLQDRPTPQQMTCVINKSYLRPVVE